MNELVVKRIDVDGGASLYDVTLGSVNLQTKGYLVHVRSTQELRLLARMKATHPLEGIEGAVVDLTAAPRAFSALTPPPTNRETRQQTFEGKIVRDPFTELKASSMLLANCRMDLSTSIVNGLTTYFERDTPTSKA